MGGTPMPRASVFQSREFGQGGLSFRVMTSPTSSPQIDPQLLEILRCPLTRSKLRLEGDFLVAEVGGLSYPVRDGFPVMLIEEAKLPEGVQSLDELKAKLNLG